MVKAFRLAWMMRKRRLGSKMPKVTAFAMLAVLCASDGARTATYPITSFDDLQGTIVRDVDQDSRGYVWLATDRGVWRWDSNGFRSLAELIPSAVPASCLAEDKWGRLWVGTSDGLEAIDVLTLEVIQPSAGGRLLEGLSINCVYKDSHGTILVGTDRGLHHLEEIGDTQRTIVVDGTQDYCIRSLAEDPAGGLWIGADQALLHLLNGRVERRYDHLIGESRVRALLRASDRSLWIGLRNQGGLYRLVDGRTWRMTEAQGLGNDEVNVLIENPLGEVWVGTEDGVFRWNGSTMLAIDRRTGLDNTDVHSLFIDREQQVWIGTFGGGVRQLRSTHVLSYGLEDGLRHPVVTALAYDRDGRLIVGTIAGAMYFEPDRRSGEPLEPGFHVWSVHLDRNGDTWLAGSSGFARAGDSTVSRALGHVNAIHDDDAGRILLGTSGGLWCLHNGHTSRVELPEDVSDQIHALFRASDGSLQVGTSNGLVRRRGGLWEHLLKDRDIQAIGEGSDGRLLVATEEGILSLDESGAEEPAQRWADAGRVRGFARDERGVTWAATDDGILRLEDDRFRRFGHRCGLPSRNVLCILGGHDGKLLAGTTHGLAEIDPDRLEPCHVAPRVVIHRVLAGANEWRSQLDGMQLPYGQRDLMIEMLPLGWRSTEGIRYQYQLAGHDDDWSEPTALGVRRYVGLRPGDYTLRAKAVNAQGLESNVTGFSFTVLLPLWFEPWFVGLTVLTGGLVGLIGVRLYARRKQLRRAAEAAREAKRDFLSRMSHEIRTPLTVILGCAERLSRRDLPYAARAECAEAVMHNGRHLLDLVNDVLDISKIRDGKMQIRRVPCDLHEILAGVESLAAHKADDKRVDFDMQVDRDVPRHILTDPTKLRQVLINLLDNAIKFTDEGVVRLRVSSRVTERKPRLRFAVEDTGIGIPPDQITAIFEAFKQADSSAGRRHRGTGLGLSICKAIVNLLGGVLEVSSEPGRGSIFVVDLPFELAEADAAAPGAAVEPTVPVDSPKDLAKVQVLLADDCADVCRMLQVMLGEAGAHVTTVSTGREVIPAALAHRYDILLIDIHMPDMDGFAVARQLLRRGITAPLMAVTADATDETCRRCAEAGFDECVTKPFAQAEIIAAIRTVIRRCQKRRRNGNGRHASDGARGHERPFEHDTRLDEPIRSSLASQSPRLAEAAAEFTYSLDNTVRELERALKERDADVLVRIAHRLKGAGGINGYMCVSEQADELKRAVEGGDYQAAAQHIAALESLRRCMITGLGADAGPGSLPPWGP